MRDRIDPSEGKGGAAGCRADRFLLVLVTGCGVFLSGCTRTTTNLRLGQQAERQGRYDLAYQHYCDEAKTHPSNRAVQSAIERVAPRAAHSYEAQAARAANAGNYAEAWKLYMRALNITPNDPAIPELVRMLEAQHPAEIASAKTAWMTEGEEALVVARTDAAPDEPPGPAPAGPLGSRPPAGDAPRPIPRQEASVPKRAAPRPSPPPRPSPSAAGPSKPLVEQPPGTAAERPIPPPRGPSEPPPTATPTETTPPHPSNGEPGYLLTAIMSVEDHRFPRRVHLVDDIHVRLRDTDAEPDADLDVYLGTTRVQKARNVAPGRTLRVRGRSGNWYELAVITVIDRTESVRVGIRASDGSRAGPHVP